MLIKNIVGILIILLNLAGVGFLLYMLAITWKNKNFSLKKNITVKENKTPVKKKRPKIVNDNIINEEDDLLKDMDLSDLDIDLDDFE
jgi:hypothetical protein